MFNKSSKRTLTRVSPDQNVPNQTRIQSFEIPILCFAKWQLWPLAVTALRTGLIFTKGHPLQVAVEITSGVIGLRALRHASVFPLGAICVHASKQYVNSLYFLDRAPFSAVDLAANNGMVDGLPNEHNVARVNVAKIFTSTFDVETKRENWAAKVVFRISPNVPNQLVFNNPLGLAIRYVREDQALK